MRGAIADLLWLSGMGALCYGAYLEFGLGVALMIGGAVLLLCVGLILRAAPSDPRLPASEKIPDG